MERVIFDESVNPQKRDENAVPLDEEFDDALDYLKAGGALALQGATFGLAPKAVALFGQDRENEYINYLNRARGALGPGWSTAAEIAGGVIPALATGGGSLLARGGVSAAKALTPVLGGTLAKGAVGVGMGAATGAVGSVAQRFGETPISQLGEADFGEAAKYGAIGGGIGGGIGALAGGLLNKTATFERRAATGGKSGEINKAIAQSRTPFAGETKLDQMVNLAEEKKILGNPFQSVETTYARASDWSKTIGSEIGTMYATADKVLGRLGVKLKPGYAKTLLASTIDRVKRSGDKADIESLQKILQEVDIRENLSKGEISLLDLWNWRQRIDANVWGTKGADPVTTKMDEFYISLRNAIDDQIEGVFGSLARNGHIASDAIETLARKNREYSAASMLARMSRSGLVQEESLMRVAGFPVVRGAIGGIAGASLGGGLGTAAEYITGQDSELSEPLAKSLGFLGMSLGAASMARGRSGNTMMWANRKFGGMLPIGGGYVGGKIGFEAAGGGQDWRFRPRTPLPDND